jgi:hypothetical protein
MPGGYRQDGDDKAHGLLIDGLMVRVDQFDQDPVRTDRKAGDDQLLAACVGPMPGRVVDGDVDVADPGRHGQRRRSEDLHDPQVLRAILYVDSSLGQGFGDGRVDDQSRRRFTCKRNDRGRAADFAGGLGGRCGCGHGIACSRREAGKDLIG